MGKSLGSMSIFTDKSLGNSSNNGLSNRFDEVLIWDCDRDENAPENAVYIKERHLFGEVIPTAYPVSRTPNGCVGGMFGGCFIYTCNGVVPFSGIAIKLHDRVETQALYNQLSR